MSEYVYNICLNIKDSSQKELENALPSCASLTEALKRVHDRLKGAAEESRVIAGFLNQPGVCQIGEELISPVPIDSPLLVPSKGLGPQGIKERLDFITVNRKAFVDDLSFQAPFSVHWLLKYPAHSIFMNAREYSDCRRFGRDIMDSVTHRDWLKEGRLAFLAGGDRRVVIQVHRRIPQGRVFLLAEQPTVESTIVIGVR